MGGHDSPPQAQNPQSNRAAKILLFLHKKMVNYKIEFNQNALFLLKKSPISEYLTHMPIVPQK